MRRRSRTPESLLAMLLIAGAVHAQPSPTGAVPQRQPIEVELGATHESLTQNRADWKSVYLDAARSFGPRHTLYGGLRETRRFGLTDTEAHAGLYYPLSDTWTGLVEATGSPDHHVLPRHALFGQLQKSLIAGLSVSAGLKQTEYDTGKTRLSVLGAEYYWSAFRAAYTFYSGRPEGASSAPAHRFQLSHYYGERSYIGIAYTDGREVENVGPPIGVIASKVTDWTLTGRHWIAPNWALAYDLVTHEQGVLYRRQGLRLGIRHSF